MRKYVLLIILLIITLSVVVIRLGLFDANKIIIDQIVIEKPSLFHLASSTKHFMTPIDLGCSFHYSCDRNITLATEGFQSISIVYEDIQNNPIVISVYKVEKYDDKLYSLISKEYEKYDFKIGKCIIKKPKCSCCDDCVKYDILMENSMYKISITSQRRDIADTVVEQICNDSENI